MAREVWMRALKDIPPRRATSDIDFAVSIKDTAHFEQLKADLVEIEGFAANKDSVFTWIASDGT